MSFFRSYFRPHREKKIGAEPAAGREEPAWRQQRPNDSSMHRPGTAGQWSQTPSGSGMDSSSLPTASYPSSIRLYSDSRKGRTVDDLTDIKCDVMVNWLQQQQLENMWSGGGPNEGVILKKRAHEFVSSPSTLSEESGGYFDAIRLLNVKVRTKPQSNHTLTFSSAQ
jgi:hypothetical protein